MTSGSMNGRRTVHPKSSAILSSASAVERSLRRSSALAAMNASGSMPS